ncbi:hypothetical protein NQ318_009897 [Aromia moschata]|uniref:Uncharacterized protein n=1 Tax=Aromia moschata TaxID=1265417 RepID=A0AAV8Y2J9_9CUCU|nr:hypothetical protein NQ318_009897 [Aromia moschata]
MIDLGPISASINAATGCRLRYGKCNLTDGESRNKRKRYKLKTETPCISIVPDLYKEYLGLQTEVDVFRKDSRKLPIGDPDIDWEETVYLNLIIHQFEYTLTLAICTRTSPKELQVLKRHSQKVYASPSRRRMDTKGEVEEITYPHICFMVDNFDEVFHDILVRDGEMVCVELLAADRAGTIQGVIFLGSIRYDALKKVYDARVGRGNFFRLQCTPVGNLYTALCDFPIVESSAGSPLLSVGSEPSSLLLLPMPHFPNLVPFSADLTLGNKKGYRGQGRASMVDVSTQ